MVWSCALALGLVWCLLTHSSVLTLWVVLALPGCALPFKDWKRALPWILAGWVWGVALQFLHQSHQRVSQDNVSTEWACLKPTFLPPVGRECKSVAVKGIWDGVDADGRNFMLGDDLG